MNETITQKDLRDLILLNAINGYETIDCAISDIKNNVHYFDPKFQFKDATINKVKLVLVDLKDALQNIDVLTDALDLETKWDEITKLKEAVSTMYYGAVKSSY